MYVMNVEEQFSKDNLFYCYSPKLKKFLCKNKNINYIAKGIHSESKKTYWLFLKTNELSESLNEWTYNSKNGLKAIE